MACSGFAMERDPMPDPAPWRALANLQERLRAGLGAVYDWYERNESMAACVLRDAEHHAVTREMIGLWIAPHMQAYQEVLGAKLNARQRAMLHLALSFFTWRTLVRDSGMKPAAAVASMVQVIECAKGR
jgi:hypothetical protein